MSHSDFPALDSRTFRQVLGQFATGVAVVTASADDGTRIGVTMSSFNSVSLDPPLVLFCVDRRAHSLPALRAARGFGINILGEGQQALSDRFARPLEDKWSAVEHRLGAHDVPLISGALAHLECAPHAIHAGGDHEIFVVRVLRISAAGTEPPLVFFRGRYHALASTDMPRG
ncbi:flavin reductase family protein [Xanthobacter sp. V4C-4]|uniref:flavin reductase family protein n=1 Tax=Xanthobacter cornucopiae TaxID=3119924 RepID=UPI0037299445